MIIMDTKSNPMEDTFNKCSFEAEFWTKVRNKKISARVIHAKNWSSGVISARVREAGWVIAAYLSDGHLILKGTG